MEVCSQNSSLMSPPVHGGSGPDILRVEGGNDGERGRPPSVRFADTSPASRGGHPTQARRAGPW